MSRKPIHFGHLGLDDKRHAAVLALCTDRPAEKWIADWDLVTCKRCMARRPKAEVPSVDDLRRRGLWPFPPVSHYHGKAADARSRIGPGAKDLA